MPEEQPILLSTLPPTRGQERLALLTALLLLAVFLATVPFAHVRLGRIDAFSPVVVTVMVLCDTITSVLLFAQFAVLRSPALLVLATGYLFTALILIPFLLVHPAAFGELGWLGGGLHSARSLLVAWHIGLPAFAIAYALLKDARPPHRVAHGAVRTTVAACTIGASCTVVALTWLVAARPDVLPAVMRNVHETSRFWNDTITSGMLALCVTAIALLWVRRRSLLDLWLLPVTWAWLLNAILFNLMDYRYNVAAYAFGLFAVSSATFVLIVLLSESTMMYTRLALSVMGQRREREGRLMTMDAVTASIAHEINQPLGAIVMSSGAGLRWLERAPPNLDEVRAALKRIADDGQRASSALQSMRAIFKRGGQSREEIVVNEIVRVALGYLHDELQARRIALQLDLTPGLPLVLGHRGQLQQVAVNIVTNAAEAMESVTERSRSLRVHTSEAVAAGVLLTVEDTGVGIDGRDCDRIFDAFYTTKPDGMGMGLAICRSIVESHGGRLWVSPGPQGAVFHMSLPAAPLSGE